MNTFINIKFPDLTKNPIYHTDIEPLFSDNMEYPLLMLGYHETIRKTIRKLDIIEKFQTRNKDGNKVYYVVNPFEVSIDDYEDDIESHSSKYFSSISKVPVMSRTFYQMWEILMIYDLCSFNKMTSVHLNDNGSFCYSTMLYRSKSKGNSNNDIYKYTGSNFNKDIKATKVENDIKADFITSYNGKYENSSSVEQKILHTIVENIKYAITYQNLGGNFVCHLSTIYTNTTLKLICLLSSCYKQVHIVVPLTSKKYNPNIYAVCISYNNKSPDVQKQLKELLNELSTGKGQYLNSIYGSYSINNDIVSNIINFNNDVTNNRLKSSIELFDFIKNKNFRGEVYNRFKDEQVRNNKMWINLFMPNTINSESRKNIIQQLKIN